MRPRPRSRLTSVLASTVLIASLATLGVLGTRVVQQDAGARSLGVRPSVEAPLTSPQVRKATRVRAVARPVHLRLDRLGIAADLDPVGVAPDGTMELPDDGARVGWYRFGPAPGSAAGSAVLAGHVDTRKGRGALFPLSRARPGDSIAVRRANGSVLRYRAVARERIPRGSLPVADLFGEDGPARLTLLTCGGRYVRGEGYTDNIVVTALPAT